MSFASSRLPVCPAVVGLALCFAAAKADEPPSAFIGCATTTVMPASFSACTPCTGVVTATCSGFEIATNTYTACTAALGRPGNTMCSESIAAVGTFWACEVQTNWGPLLACIGAGVGCGIECVICVGSAGEGNDCAFCTACLIGILACAPCEIYSCGPDAATATPVMAWTFNAMTGSPCNVGNPTPGNGQPFGD